MNGKLLALKPDVTLSIVKNVTDVKGTVIKIAKQKFEEIWTHWPLLRNELKTRSADGEQGEKKGGDYYELYFKNGSTIFVISKDTSRGILMTLVVIKLGLQF